MKTVIFVTFENECAPLGGLAAVMRVLPRRVAEQRRGRCFTITPLFREIVKCRPAVMESIRPTGIAGTLEFGRTRHRFEIWQRDDHGYTTYFVDSPEFFNAPCDCDDPGPEAPCNPYVTPAQPDQLQRDALFFCAAVPKALVGLHVRRDLILCLQDWETACTAMTAKREPGLSSVSCLLTLHNSYDPELSAHAWRAVSPRRRSGRTVLSKMAGLFDGPICTVSQQFAHELEHEPVQRKIFAPHLQKLFREQTICGIDNGTFHPRDVPVVAGTRGARKNGRLILREKSRRRREMIRALTDYVPSRAWGTLDLTNFEGPVFLFSGRDDARQKGYDVAAAAIQRVPVGRARYVFTPIPGDEGEAGLSFLRKLAEEREGEVKVFPFRMASGYGELQRGASFMVMCSFYEPFGSATEGYAVGTPVVARATGGLVQQIVPYPGRSLTAAVKKLSGRYHQPSDPPTGFLYREPDGKPKETEREWRQMLNLAHQHDRVAERATIPLFQAMVDQAAAALHDALELYETDQTQYGTMILNGLSMLEKFSWEKTVQHYQEIFETLSSVE